MASRIVSSALAGAFALGIAAAPAVADTRPVVGACPQLTDASLMRDTGQSQNLTVRKTAGNPYDDAAVPLGSIEGIEFKLYSVRGLRLSTDSGLSQAQHLTVDQARANGLDYVGSQRTDANGDVVFRDVKPAMYLVEEVAPADTAHNYRTSDPFLVLMPTLKEDCVTPNEDTVIVVKSHADTTTPPSTPPSTRRIPPPIPPITPGTPGAPGTVTTTATPPPTGVAEPPSTVTTTSGAGSPGSPGSPGGPGNPGDTPKRNGPGGPLASTGANVIWLLVVAAALITGGILLVRNRKDDSA